VEGDYVVQQGRRKDNGIAHESHQISHRPARHHKNVRSRKAARQKRKQEGPSRAILFEISKKLPGGRAESEGTMKITGADLG